ncbi:MAG: flagellar biosynthesis protein FliQ [Solirubrobacterales bacterium]
MNESTVIGIAKEAMYHVILVSSPILGGSLLVGLVISILQATTQIQEQTLAFVPKIIAVFVIFIIFGPWMINLMVGFTNNLYADIPRLITFR